MRHNLLLRIILQFGPDQTMLDQLRAELGLSRSGRLEDDEDEGFGTCYLLKERSDVWLELLRNQDFRSMTSWTWTLEVSYYGLRPSTEMVDQWRSQILRAVEAVGLRVHKVIQWYD